VLSFALLLSYDIPEEERINSWFLIPYIQKVTDKFKNIASSIKAKLAFFSLNKLEDN